MLTYIGVVVLLVVATGDNGVATKSSDEIGRLTALCILDWEAYEQEQLCGKFCKRLVRSRVSRV